MTLLELKTRKRTDGVPVYLIVKCGVIVGTYLDEDQAKLMLEMHAESMRAATS